MKLRSTIGSKMAMERFSGALDALILNTWEDLYIIEQYNLIELKRKITVKLMNGLYGHKRNFTVDCDINTFNSLKHAFGIYILKKDRIYDNTAIFLNSALSDMEIDFENFKMHFEKELNRFRQELLENIVSSPTRKPGTMS